MSLLSATSLSKSYGVNDIFNNLSLDIPRGARIAIVGPNGIGKTTLLRILVGLEEPSSGSVQMARKLTIGYLPQEAYLTGSHTLWEECLAAISDLRSLENELALLENSMSDPQQADQALERYGRLQPEFERRGGYTYETRIRQTLSGLGFDCTDFHRPIPQLSGGQRTRALLARLLLSDADLLILDEPTNHLDIHAVEWLEGYLSQWEGATLIVSHDRYFLDQVVDHIWELSASGLEVYRGNYSSYLQQRQVRWERRQQLYETEKERLLKELDYIKRNISGQNVTQAKGKLRRLSREVQAIELLGFEAVLKQSWSEISDQVEISSHPLSIADVERRIKSLRGPKKRPPRLHLHLKASQRSGDLVLRTRNLIVGYPDEGRPLFRAPDLLLKRGDCASVIGPNGAGKTTFLKTILAQMPPLEGEVILGSSLLVGYFTQAHEDLIPERNLVQEIEAVAPEMLLADIRDYLGRFLFTGDDVFQKISTLSGGERGRMALAKLSLMRTNLLLLDEPTNHLDIPSQEILQEVLADYQGTILLVSHDRYLIDALGSQIWEILTGQSTLMVFNGTYTQYREYLEKQAEQASKSELAKEPASSKRRHSTSPILEERKRHVRLKEVEDRIALLEGTLATLSRKLESPPVELGKVQRLGQEYVLVQDELNVLLGEWEQLHTARNSE
jgi:ATP-binding cassette subfamily F protein 3